MPYIKSHLRGSIDDKIEDLVNSIHNLYIGNEEVNKNKNGVANYVITRIILGLLKPNNGWNYDSLSDVNKTLECSKQEIYFRLVSLYESNKTQENGDVRELKEAEDRFLS